MEGFNAQFALSYTTRQVMIIFSSFVLIQVVRMNCYIVSCVDITVAVTVKVCSAHLM